jgi:hypothetical protein
MAQPEQESFRLVVKCVAEKEMQNACAPAPVAHQLVARVPGRGLDSAGGFRTAPGKNVMINAFRAQPLADLGRFGSGFGTQTVVNA